MILKCAYCDGQMRVDEAKIPHGKRVRIRCPHCDGIGLAALDEQAGDPGEAASDASERRAGTHEAGDAVFEPSVPDDAFNGFRFPSEEETGKPAKAAWSTGARIGAWIGASIVIVAVFALVVNLVLPGPPR